MKQHWDARPAAKSVIGSSALLPTTGDLYATNGVAVSVAVSAGATVSGSVVEDLSGTAIVGAHEYEVIHPATGTSWRV